jgi:beta-lactam-binding protein with PASTA domain
VAATSMPAAHGTLAPVSASPIATVQKAALKTTEQPRGTVVLDVAGGVQVPDFRGKSLRSALEEAESAGIELEVNGSGVGREQSPAAGSRIPPGGHVSVVFGR